MILRLWRRLWGEPRGCAYEAAADGQRVRIEARTPAELVGLVLSLDERRDATPCESAATPSSN
jgi:hypothetical protein